MATQAAPSQSEVERAFGDAMQAAGFLPGMIEANSAGFVRFDAPGDKPGKRNGFYKLKLGQWPVGWFGDWKSGEQQEWSWHQSQGQQLSEAERRSIARERARLKAEAAQAREAKQAEVAEEASRMWGQAESNVEGHPYLGRKLIDIPRGLRVFTARDATRLLAVPMWSFDMNGAPKLTSLQLISPDGEKRFLKAGRVDATWFSLKGDTSCIIICEGVATAFSIWKATGLGVVAAFNSGNLIEVAKEFARHRPAATLVIAADDDAIAPDDWADRGSGRPWVNAGVSKAEAAARAVGCRWIKPVFKDGQARGRTDFNDLHALEGLDAVSAQILGAIKGASVPEDMEPGATIVDIGDRVQDESWRSKIPLTSQGAPDGANVEGVAVYIANHRLLRDRVRYNAFTKEIELDGNALEDHHVAEYRRIMHADRFKARKGDVMDEMAAAARRDAFDPLTDYLGGVTWDLTPRLDTWMARYLGVQQSPYVEAIGRAALIGSVARALQPGCKLDTMVILEGPQGTGKSTAIRYLYGDRFFTDNLPDFHSKDSFQQLQGSWCVEVAELNRMSKADTGDVKAFLSRLEDKFRPPYERLPIKVRRRTVLWGTVNPEEGGYLKDQTGNRRFYPVETGKIDTDAILRDRDQLWAEAVTAFKLGEAWHLEGEVADEAKAEQEARREVHPWETLLREWVATNFYHEATAEEALIGAIKLTPDRMDPRASRQIGQAFRAIGWASDAKWRGGKTVKLFSSPERQKENALSGGPGPRPAASMFAERDPVDDFAR